MNDMQPNIELVPREEPEIRLSINTPIEELLKHKEFEEFFLIELRILMIKLIYPYLTEQGLDQILRKIISEKYELRRVAEGKRRLIAEFEEDKDLNKRIGKISQTYAKFAGLDLEGLKKLDIELYDGRLFKRINIQDIVSITLEECFGIIEKEELEGRS